MTKYALGDFVMVKSAIGNQVFQITSITQTLEADGKTTVHYKSATDSFEESSMVGRVTLEGHRKRKPRQKKTIQNTPGTQSPLAVEPEFPFTSPAQTKTA